MSKLYEQYLKLKYQDPEKLYLFKSGIFLLALEDDAINLSKKLNLKLTNLGNTCIKCGFPECRYKYYAEQLNLLNINFTVIYSELKKEHQIKTFSEKDVSQKNVERTHFVDFNMCTVEISKQNNTNEALELIHEIADLDINNLTLKNSFDKLYDFHMKSKKIINKSNQ